MKKYGKSSFTFIAIILVIATFYIQDRLSASSYPTFEITSRTGDKTELEPVSIEGFYSEGRMNPINERFRLTTGGTHYYSEASYAEQISRGWQAGFIEQLLKKHRQFMRGKHQDPSAFYESEKVVAYGIADFHMGRLGTESEKHKFQLSVLDKEKQETISFETDIPDGDHMKGLYVSEVQVLDGVLKLMTINEYAAQDETEVHVYDFDISEKKLINDETAATFTDPDGEQYVAGELVARTAHDLDKSHVVIRKQILQNEPREHGHEIKQISTDLILYNMETNKTRKINQPKSLPVDAEAAAYDGSFIYFKWENENGFQIAAYSIKDEKVIQQAEVAGAVGNAYTIKNGKLYLVTEQQIPDIYIVELKTGEVLYEGEITYKKQSANQNNDELFFSEINVK